MVLIARSSKSGDALIAAMCAELAQLRSGLAPIIPTRNIFVGFVFIIVFAKEMATLDHLSGGRVLLGVGVGVGWSKEEYDAIGVEWPSRGKHMDEYIGAMRALWSGNPASSFRGETVSFEDAYCFPKPVSNDIPIAIGGDTEIAMKRVACVGNAWLPIFLTPGDALEKIGRVHALMKDHGRDPAKLRIIKNVGVTHTLDDLKRWQDVGITEFSLRAEDLPSDENGLVSHIEKLERYV